MKLLHIKLHACHRNVTEHDYLKKWKALGFEIVEDIVNSISSILVKPEDNPQDIIKRLDTMEYQDLKKYAAELEINTYKLKKEEIKDKIITTLNQKGE